MNSGSAKQAFRNRFDYPASPKEAGLSSRDRNSFRWHGSHRPPTPWPRHRRATRRGGSVGDSLDSIQSIGSESAANRQPIRDSLGELSGILSGTREYLSRQRCCESVPLLLTAAAGWIPKMIEQAKHSATGRYGQWTHSAAPPPRLAAQCVKETTTAGVPTLTDVAAPDDKRPLPKCPSGDVISTVISPSSSGNRWSRPIPGGAMSRVNAGNRILPIRS